MDSSEVLRNQISVIKIFGLLPPKGSFPLRLCYGLWTIVVFFVGGFGLFMSQSVSFWYAKSLNDFIEQLLLFCTASTVAVKMLFFYVNRNRFFKVLNALKKLDHHLSDEEDFNRMREIYKICNRINIFYTCVYSGTMLSLFLQLPFLERHELVWKSTALLPYDFAQNPSIYYSILIFQAIGNSMNCLLSWVIDTHSLVLTLLFGAHIDVLNLRSESIELKSHKFQLIECLNYYKHLSCYSQKLNMQLSSILFVQVGISAPVICICAYQFSQAQNLTSVQLLFLSGYTMGMIMQIFSPNFIGTLTLDKSAWLPNSAFASQWFNFDRSAKKALLLFMTRTSRPFVLKAGIFFQLNLNTFLRIMKTAYSFLAVLRSSES